MESLFEFNAHCVEVFTNGNFARIYFYSMVGRGDCGMIKLDICTIHGDVLHLEIGEEQYSGGYDGFCDSCSVRF